MTKNIFQKYYHNKLRSICRNFNGIVVDNKVQEIDDLQNYFTKLHGKLNSNEKVLITYHNHSWEPILLIATSMGLRKKVGQQNWLDENDIKGILKLSGFEIITTQKRLMGLITTTVAKPKPLKLNNRKYSVSIIIPARNEEENISNIVPSIPRFGKSQEIIFIEGHSHDNTWEKITAETMKKREVHVLGFKQKGKGKADAVWLGFAKAKGEILMIYDADRTVDAKDLSKFYNAMALNFGDFANGSRMVYPMENQAMQTLNKIANKMFSTVFTWILGQRFKDTLCGTKALFKKDYLYMKKHNKKYFKMDPFGDFALIFGAIKNNLKVIEIPVRYKERVYGTTNIKRFKHGLILLKMAVVALKEFKG